MSGPTAFGGAWDPLPHGHPHGHPHGGLWQRPPPPPRRPRYRESRPVRALGVLAGIGGALLWFVLLLLASWSATSFVVCQLIGMIVAGIAAAVLLWRGDRGAAVGIASVIGFAMTWTVFGGLLLGVLSGSG